MNWRQAIVVSLAVLFLAVSAVAGTTGHDVARADEQHHALGASRQPGVDNLAVDSADQVTGVLLAATPRVNAVAFSPDGKLLASADASGTVRLWDLATGQFARAPLQAGPGSVNGVAFSPDGDLLASADANGTVRLWNPATGQPAGAPLQAGPGSVNGVAFSPDGKLLASADASGTIRLWNPATGQPAGAPLQAGPGSVNGVAFSPDGDLLASADANGVRVWGRAAGQRGGQDDVGWVAILTFVIAVAVSALAVIITARGTHRLKKLRNSPGRWLWRS